MAARGTGTGSRRGLAVVAGVVVLALVAGVVAWTLLRGDDGGRPRPAEDPAPSAGELADGPVTFRYPADAFAVGDTPALSLTTADDDFLETFAVPGIEPTIADITASSQPATEVEVLFDYDPAELPDDAVPAIFYLDTELDLWLPIPTVVDEAAGRLVGTTDHLTWFTTALTTLLDGAEKGAQWLRYQTARAVGARADAPDCGADAPPRWVVRQDADQGLNDPLPTCLTTTDAGDLELHLVVNRGYSLSLSGPIPDSVEFSSTGATSDILYQTLVSDENGSDGSGSDGEVFLPARVDTVLTYARDALPPGRVELTGRATPRTAAMDLVVAAVEFLAGRIPHALTALAGMLDCASDAVSASLDDGQRIAGAMAEAVASCAEPVLLAAGAAGSEAARKLTTALQASLLLGRGAQNALDAATAWQEPADVLLQVQGAVPAAPDGAVWLHDALLTSGGVGPSGAPVSVSLGGMDAPSSTSQWVGCEGEPAWGEYDLAGRSRLTALLGLRDFTPLELVVQVRVLVDGTLVEEFTLDGPAIAVDLDLPPGSVLRLEAQRTAGECTAAPEGYGVWGNGALS